MQKEESRGGVRIVMTCEEAAKSEYHCAKGRKVFSILLCVLGNNSGGGGF